MKATFIVTVEGDWHHNGKPVTTAIVERELREAAKDRFDWLATCVTVKRAIAPAQGAMVGEQHAKNSAEVRDIFAICDAYESGVGHGLQRDGHKSGAMFSNPEHGKAYEIGYEVGEERAQADK